MNTQDIIHQAQDVFDRVTHRSSPLLPVLMEHSCDSSSSGSSVLTNVAPPSALPSFLTSPLPSVAPSTLPPGPSIPPPGAPTVPPPGPAIPPPGPPNVPPPGVSIPSPRGVPYPPSSGSSVHPGSGVPSLSAGPPTFMPASGPPLPAQASPSPTLPPHHSPTPSNPADPGLPPAPQPYFAPSTSNSPNPVTSQPQPPSSYGSVDASSSVDLGSPGVDVSAKRGEGRGWFGWIRGTVSSVGHRVAERAKTSMDTMITTLDPQMKEFIHSGGDVDIIVASDKEVKVGAVREAFQIMFGKATVSGMAAQAEGVAAQPVGFDSALKSAEERINFLRSSGHVHPQQPIIAVENFIVEFSSDCWFDLGLLLLDDPGEDIILQTYTQVTPVPLDFITQARNSTPEDYPFKESGFATTVGQIASQSLQVPHTQWQESLTGVSRREALVLAARTLAGLYRARMPQLH